MKKLRKMAVALLLVQVMSVSIMPAMAHFDQTMLDGIVMISTGAPDENGVMHYYRGTGFSVGTEGGTPHIT